mmetsp:Transcript_32367/g.58799  ORF Transcript_32367/g.58799 Transcript_32367/m.58799 type:complete len:297 (+) Transcript_32367:1795-2685(+)
MITALVLRLQHATLHNEQALTFLLIVDNDVIRLHLDEIHSVTNHCLLLFGHDEDIVKHLVVFDGVDDLLLFFLCLLVVLYYLLSRNLAEVLRFFTALPIKLHSFAGFLVLSFLDLNLLQAQALVVNLAERQSLHLAVLRCDLILRPGSCELQSLLAEEFAFVHHGHAFWHRETHLAFKDDVNSIAEITSIGDDLIFVILVAAHNFADLLLLFKAELLEERYVFHELENFCLRRGWQRHCGDGDGEAALAIVHVDSSRLPGVRLTTAAATAVALMSMLRSSDRLSKVCHSARLFLFV